MLLSSGAPSYAKKRRQRTPMSEQVGNRLAEPRVRLRLALGKLRFQPAVQLVHHQTAPFLMKPHTAALPPSAHLHALQHHGHTPGPASPARSGIRRESSPPLLQTVSDRAPGNWPAESPLR